MRLPKINTWQYEFESRILERGYSYYYSGLVDNVQKTALGWTATAHGLKDYDVHIVMSPIKVLDMHCTCPYARNGAHCKHEAALLYQITEEADPVHPKPKVIQSDHEDPFQRPDRMLASSEEIAEDVYWMLSGLEEEFSDWDGEIDWESGPDYAAAFCDILKNQIEPLLKQKRFEAAFHCLDKAFTVINMTELNGSLGEYSVVGNEIGNYWKKIIRAVSPQERKEIKVWFEELCEKGEYLICSDVIEDVLKQEFDDSEEKVIRRLKIYGAD